MRKLTRLSREQLSPYVWEMPNPKRPTAPADEAHPIPPMLDWQALFGNPGAVEVEVGMGKGLFLLTSALAQPLTNFFGIEIVRKYQLYAATRYAVRGLANIKTTCADAKLLFHNLIPAGSVSAVHILFPDPWWKKRHKKRRVFTEEFAIDVARAIRVGGRLYIASDVEEYFEVMTGIVLGMAAFAQQPAETAPDDIGGFQTNFERKAQLKGTPIWRAVFERSGDVGIER